MLESVRVWAVELGPGPDAKEREGRLSMLDDALRFEPAKEGQAPLTLPFGRLTKVRRLRGSPVLMVVCRLEDREVRTAFYFVQPPPLTAFTEERTDTRVSLPTLRNPKRKARRDNVGYLGIMNREKKEALIAWEREVRAAAAAAKGA
ncbi:MAG: hypothetical protein ACM3WR_12855 [Solirubrobacterales bacterium]